MSGVPLAAEAWINVFLPFVTDLWRRFDLFLEVSCVQEGPVCVACAELPNQSGAPGAWNRMLKDT